jgi:protein farnesyltransferase/geranylgeranyltransferase type-1 subunit alpha
LDTFLALEKDVEDELHFLDDLVMDNPKCYQIWFLNLTRHHRQALSSIKCDPNREFDFINKQLDEDSKNYHAWAYR